MAKLPQLTDEQGNKVPASPLLVFSKTLDKVQAEQNRIRDTEGQGKPNAAIVVDRMWTAYEKTINASDWLEGFGPDEQEYARAFLEAIKVSRNWTQMKPILEPYLKPPATKPTKKVKAS